MAGSIDVFEPLAGASQAVLDAVLRLNQDHVAELSHLDQASLRRLIDAAFWASVANGGDAFALAFDQDADYDSLNFRWFKDRYERFVYVDRIAVAGSARGRSLANRLYRNLFDEAAAQGHSIVVCEVNLEPPNHASDAFHRSHEFEEVGAAKLTSRKTVRYLAKPLVGKGE